jgi:hypothetical protein
VAKTASTVSASKRLTYDIRREPPPIRTVTESRLLGLLRWSRLTGGLYAVAAGYGTLAILDYRQFYVCRAVQAWQLTPATFAAVWIDSAAEGVHLFHQEQLAREKFQLLCAALDAKDPPPTLLYRVVDEGVNQDDQWEN